MRRHSAHGLSREQAEKSLFVILFRAWYSSLDTALVTMPSLV